MQAIETLIGAWSVLRYVQGQVKSLHEQVSGKLRGMDRELQDSARHAKALKQVMSFVSEHRELFGDQWREVQDEVLRPITDAAVFLDRVPHVVESGVAQTTVLTRDLSDEVNRQVAKHDGDSAVRDLWRAR